MQKHVFLRENKKSTAAETYQLQQERTGARTKHSRSYNNYTSFLQQQRKDRLLLSFSRSLRGS
jgi:hypothetical protein